MTKEELDDIITIRDLENSLYLPEEFTFDSIIGISSYGNVVYDKYKLIHCFAVEYALNDGLNYEELSEEDKGKYEEEGLEWVEYNVLGSFYSYRITSMGIPPLFIDLIDDIL